MLKQTNKKNLPYFYSGGGQTSIKIQKVFELCHMTSVASSQFSHCIQEAPQIKSTWKSLFQENTAYRPGNLDEYEYNEYNFHAANIIFKNYFQPFKDKKKNKPFLAFRPYQHNLGVEFGPWNIRCNGLFYPFIVDSPTHRDHHSKTEWLSYLL